MTTVSRINERRFSPSPSSRCHRVGGACWGCSSVSMKNNPASKNAAAMTPLRAWVPAASLVIQEFSRLVVSRQDNGFQPFMIANHYAIDVNLCGPAKGEYFTRPTRFLHGRPTIGYYLML